MQKSQQQKVNLVAALIVVLNIFMNKKIETQKKWMKYLDRHKRFGIIVIAIIALNLAYGFDARFPLSTFFGFLLVSQKLNNEAHFSIMYRQ